MDPRQLKQLNGGKLKPTATLDLHGYDLLPARGECLDFLSTAQASGHRYVLIIHGIGTGRLASHCQTWVQEHPAVRHCQQAPNSMGGAGALLVMLKRSD